MKAAIICDVCLIVLGNIEKKKITARDIENYKGCFTCDCGGEANLVIVDE